jgi:hypothetical protein
MHLPDEIDFARVLVVEAITRELSGAHDDVFQQSDFKPTTAIGDTAASHDDHTAR